MNIKVMSGALILVLAVAASTNAWSKSEGKGGGMRSDHPKGQMDRDKSSDSKYRKEEKVREHRDDEDAKERREEHEERREREEKAYREHQNNNDTPAGLAKQRDKKTVQEQKELGRGSEQGQKSREENSRKWWKLWGE